MKKIYFKSLVLFFAVLLVGLGAQCQFFWVSNVTADWNTPTNWSATSGGPGGIGVPGPTDLAIFDGGGIGPAKTSADIVVGSIDMTAAYPGVLNLSGFVLTVNGDVTIDNGGLSQGTNAIQINGNITINGGVFTNISGTTFVEGNVAITNGTVSPSTVILEMNSSVDQSINFAAGLSLHELIVSKPAGVLNYLSDVWIADQLQLTQGIVNTNTHTFLFGSPVFVGTLIIGTGKINGIFERWVPTTAIGSLIFPMGNAVANAPFDLNVITSPTTAGTYTVQYNDAAPGWNPVSFLDGPAVITTTSTASFTTLAGNGLAGGSYDLAMTDDHLTRVIDVSKLHLTLANGVVGIDGGASGPVADPTVNRDGLIDANISQTFFFGAEATALPVKWDSFNADFSTDGTRWTWVVSDEINLSYYQPEYSVDGIYFTPAGKVAATDKLAQQQYNFIKSTPASSKTYCRVKAVDFDGKYYYTQIIVLNSTPVTAFTVWPNPARNLLYMQMPGDFRGTTIVQVVSIVGRICASRSVTNANNLQVDLSRLPEGVYFVKLISAASGELQAVKSFVHTAN